MCNKSYSRPLDILIFVKKLETLTMTTPSPPPQQENTIKKSCRSENTSFTSHWAGQRGRERKSEIFISLLDRIDRILGHKTQIKKINCRLVFRRTSDVYSL